MKFFFVLTALLNSIFINAVYASETKCVPEYVVSVLQKGKQTINGDWVHNNRSYKLWINEKKMTVYDMGVEGNLNSAAKENITTRWYPAKDKINKSSEYCEFKINDNRELITGKLFPYSYERR